MSEVNSIPKHWQIKKLGELCSIVYGKGLPVKELKPFGYPVFGANGIIGFNDKYMYEQPQVLISCRGAASGKINLSPAQCYVTNNSLILDIKKKEELNKEYLFYSLSIAKKTKLVTGTAQPQVTINNAIELDIPLPPLPEQLTIVSKIEELLSDLENGKQQLLTAQQQLKIYRQSLLKWAFEGKLTNKNVKDGELPKGWKLLNTGNIIETINNGYTPTKEFLSEGSGEIPFIKVYNLNFDGTLNFKKNPTYIPNTIHKKDLKRSICLPGDVLINIVGPPLGKVSIVPNQFPEWNINQAIVLFRPNREILSKYISYFVQNPVTVNWLEGTSKATAGQWNVKVSTCRVIPIPIPPIEEQQLIVDELESKLTVCDKIEETISQSLLQAESLRQSILKQAFEGKLI